MREQLWNQGWKFWADKDSFALVWNVPENARDVTLPHDPMIENKPYAESPNGGNTGFRDGDCYTYVKLFTPGEDWAGKTALVRFDGVYMNAMVYLNGQFIAKSPFGYTTFFAELSDYLKLGEVNELRVLVRAGAMGNSRWYSGAGIYRDVTLYLLPKACIVPEGIVFRTERIEEEYAVLLSDVEIENRESCAVRLTAAVEVADYDGGLKAKQEKQVFLTPGEKRTLHFRMTVSEPELWSDEVPVLSQGTVRLLSEGKTLDETKTIFGIRTISADAKRGLLVNGHPVKLRGACIHHDSGLLGAATYPAAELRRVKLLKEAGFNAIRMSHHPASEQLLRACDVIGLYVMDELSDMWNRMKSGYDYGLSFSEWWEKDLTSMVRKDRNHPSVVLYSIGNEIPEIGTDQGAALAHQISEKFHELDPSRLTTAGINGVFAAGDYVPEIVRDVAAGLSEEEKQGGNVNDFMTLMDGHMDEIVVHKRISERLEMATANLDVAGYNYMAARYEPDGSDYPDRVIVGSETYPPDIARNWELVKQLPYVIGDFTWTGWDYIGEAGVGIPAYRFGEGGFGAGFPSQLAYCGDIDITGFRRPASYFREIVFGFRKEPYLAVQTPEHYGETLIKTPWVISDAIHSWSYPGFEGKPIIVEVYAPGDEVELFVNGRSLGRQQSGKEAGYRTLFETVYEPGTLLAVAYENGKELSRQELLTAGEAVTLSLEKEGSFEEELTYYTVELLDAEGRLVTCDDQVLTLETDTPEVILLGSGDPKPEYNYDEGKTRTWNGRAQVIVKRTDGKSGAFILRSESGLTASVK